MRFKIEILTCSPSETLLPNCPGTRWMRIRQRSAPKLIPQTGESINQTAHRPAGLTKCAASSHGPCKMSFFECCLLLDTFSPTSCFPLVFLAHRCQMEERVQVCRYLEIDTSSEAERIVRLILRVTQYKEGINIRRDSDVFWDEQQTTIMRCPGSSVNYMHSALSRYIHCSLPFTNVGLSLLFRYYCVFIISNCSIFSCWNALHVFLCNSFTWVVSLFSVCVSPLLLSASKIFTNLSQPDQPDHMSIFTALLSFRT